jgi:hypothetical protein
VQRCRGGACFPVLADVHYYSLGVRPLKLSVLFLALACFSSLLPAQEDPVAFICVGRGLAINSYYDLWKPGANTSVAAGYRVWPGLFLVGCYDYTPFSFEGYYQNTRTTGSYSLISFLVGAKASMTIPGKVASPYFLGLIGVSWTTSTQDTAFSSSPAGELRVYPAALGETFTFLGAVGSDIRIYKGLFAFLEVRAGAGLDSQIYDITLMYRAGVGFNFF